MRRSGDTDPYPPGRARVRQSRLTGGFQDPVVDSNKLERGEVWGETDSAVHWAGAFAVYGGHGATASWYEVEPGKRLGRHTDATEERKYIIAGTGKLYLEDGSTWPVGPGSVFVAADAEPRDRKNTGKETLRAVAFFAAAMFTQDFDQVMLRRRATSSARRIATADRIILPGCGGTA